MKKQFLIWGALFGGLAVILGALGAHALKGQLSAEELGAYETAVKYQMYHAILLIVLSNIQVLQSKKILYATVIGILLFSFSIYLLSLRHLIGIEGLKVLGPITPLGGLLLIFVWFSLLVKGIKLKN